MISVIVPVFNVERYLSKCLDSICAQTYRNLEIIIIDDGSTDKSPQICDEYAKQDERIKVIHKENGGLSSARNIGLDTMLGKYVTFVDSDDWIEANMCEELLNELVGYECDMVIGLQFDNYEDGKEMKQTWYISEYEREILSKKDAMLAYLKRKISGTSCGILYKKCIFQDIRFPIGKQFEDQAIVFLVLKKTERIIIYNKYFYHYFHRANSITSVPFNAKKMHYLDAFESWFEYSKNNGNIFKEEIEKFYTDYAWDILKSMGLEFGGENSIHSNKLVSIIRKNKKICKNPAMRLDFLFLKAVSCKWIPFQVPLIVKYILRLVKNFVKRKPYV